VLVLVNLLLYFSNMYMDRDSFTLFFKYVYVYVNDFFVIVIDFVIAVMEKYLELEKRTCVRRRAGLRAHTRLIFFVCEKSIDPGCIVAGIKRSGTFVPATSRIKASSQPGLLYVSAVVASGGPDVRPSVSHLRLCAFVALSSSVSARILPCDLP